MKCLNYQLAKDGTSNKLLSVVLLLLAITIVTVSLIVAFNEPTHAYLTPESSILNPFLLSKYHPYNTSNQKLAHQILLLLIGATFLVLGKLQQRDIFVDSRFSVGSNKKISTVLLIILFVVAYIFTIATGWQLQLNFSYWLIQVSLLFILAFLRTELTSTIVLILTVLAIMASWLPGLFSPPDLSNWSIGSIIEFGFHWSFLVAPADLLSRGRILFKDVCVPYGCLLPVIIGGWQLHFGAFTINQLIQINRFLNFIFLSSFLWLYYSYARRKALPVAICIAMILPLFHYSCKGIFTPNHSAWRFLAFPLAFACLFACRKLLLQWQCAITGMASGLSILYNVETGVAICISFIFYNYLRWTCKPKAISPLKLTFIYASGIIAALLLFVVITDIWLGQLISLRALAQAFYYLRLVCAAGYTGSLIEFEPTAIIMLVHSTFVILWTAISRPVLFRSKFRATIAMCLLVWFAYWFNRPTDTGLMMMYPLYGFLIIDLFQSYQRSLNTSSLWSTLALGAILSIIVFTDCRKSWMNEWPQYIGSNFKKDDQKVLVSGVYFSKAVANYLIQRSKFIDDLDDQSPIFLSPAQYYITKITAKYPSITYADPFECTLTKTDVDKLLSQIIHSGKKTIFIDHGFEPVAEDKWWLPFYQPCINYYKVLREYLSPYYKFEKIKDSGWEVWRLNDSL